MEPAVDAIAGKLTLGPAVGDELQDGDNSLEPGELVTPPHHGDASPQVVRDQEAALLKKIIAKDVMSKTLRKLSQIDSDTCEEKVRAILELEVMRRKEAKIASETQRPLENGSGNYATNAVATTAAIKDENTDSEGLYSDTDSSTEEQKNVEDVQQARKEKQAEAAAALTPAPPPAPLPFLRFHMRPPCYDFQRIGFMPRMRGGMRSMRPSFYGRPPLALAQAAPMPPTRHPAPIVTPAPQPPAQSTPVAAYGPALPPNACKTANSQGQVSTTATVRGKPEQSDMVWTITQPPISFIFNLVSECGNSQHKGCKPKLKTTASVTKKATKSKETPSKQRSRERSRERRSLHVSRDKDKSSTNKSKSKSSKSERPTQSNSKVKTPPGTDAKELRLTPPVETTKDGRKAFDIFAESPPRLTTNTATSTMPKKPTSAQKANESNAAEPSKTKREKTPETKVVERSTTPPLTSLYAGKTMESKSKPLLKASEIHSRIGALLQDNDLESGLEALLATKEQLLRKTNAHRNKTSTKTPTIVPKEQNTGQREASAQSNKIVDEAIKQAVRVKQEQPDTTSAGNQQDKWGDKQKEQERRERHTTSPDRRLNANPFKREAVLNESPMEPATEPQHNNSHERRRENSSRESQHSARTTSKERRSELRHGRSRSRERYNDARKSADYKRPTVKLEKNRSNTPTRPANQQPMLVMHIKVERDVTPPSALPQPTVRNGVIAANAPPPAAVVKALSKVQQSPDTDDYIDNWENDDSMAGDSSTPKTMTANAGPVVQLMNGLDDDEDSAASYSNRLWNAKSTPPPKSRLNMDAMLPLPAAAPAKSLINIHELYDKFMKSIKMGSAEATATAADVMPMAMAANGSGPEGEASKNSSLSNSTAEEEESSSTETTSSSSSSEDDGDDDDDDDESSTDEEQQGSSDEEQQAAVEAAKDASTKSVLLKHDNHKKNNVSKDLRKLKNLEENLARIQMMRENYDSGDDICEELLKMESLFLMQKNAIMNKYRKHDLKLAEPKQQPMQPPPQSPINNIFAANREAIKLTISPLKLTRKSAILDKDDAEPLVQQQPQTPPQHGTKSFAGPPSLKPAKEIAIVKPTIMDTKSSKRSSPRRPRDRSHSRTRSRRASLTRSRTGRSRGDASRSISPRRWRPHSPRIGSRPRFAKRPPRSRSRSFSRSRSRSRSPQRRRRLKFSTGRRRNSLSPLPPPKALGPRSPPLRRRSYSRERYSRSPLPFKPPSPPMRRSWSSSHSRSPTRRRTRSRSRSASARTRSPFGDYFEENHSLEAAAYYYNMSLLHGGEEAGGDGYAESYAAYAAAYMDTAYNMDDAAYAQYMEYSNTLPMTEAGHVAAPPSAYYGDYCEALPAEALNVAPVLRELPMATSTVVLQKGNVLEIVPSDELADAATLAAAAAAAAATTASELMEQPGEVAPEPSESESKPKRKRVNFVDHVLPNYESEDEDRSIVQRAVEQAIKQGRERRSQPAKLQRLREELLALPAPPPPATPKPTHLEKAICLRKKPKIRYFHFDPFRATIVRTQTRILRPPRFDPKYMAMLMKSGRFPMPPFNFHALRHRPPLPPHALAKASTARAAMLGKDNFVSIPTHPPPPLGHVMHNAAVRPPRPPFFGNYLRLRPPAFSAMTQAQPIPVVGQSYTHYPLATAAPIPTVTPATPSLLAPPEPLARNPYNMHFTPPPLPSLQPSFTVNSVPTIKEIMPVDILQKIGPLPKTLDLDSTPSADEINADLKDKQTNAMVFDVLGSESDPAANTVDPVCQPQLVETQ